MLESIVYVWNIESMRSNQQWIAQVASILTQEVQDEEWFFFSIVLGSQATICFSLVYMQSITSTRSIRWYMLFSRSFAIAFNLFWKISFNCNEGLGWDLLYYILTLALVRGRIDLLNQNSIVLPVACCGLVVLILFCV